MTPENLRDLTFQRVADWSDARFGVNCFALSRWLFVVSAVGIVGDALALRNVDGFAGMPGCLATGIAWVGLAEALAWYVARASARPGPVVVPALRNRVPAVVGFVHLAGAAVMSAILWYDAMRLVALGGHRLPGFGNVMASTVLTQAALLCAPAAMLATCRWNRLPRARRRGRVAVPRTSSGWAPLAGRDA